MMEYRSYGRANVSSIVYNTIGEVNVHGKNDLKRIIIEAVEIASLIPSDELDIRRSKYDKYDTANDGCEDVNEYFIIHKLSLVHPYADFVQKDEH